MFSPLHANFMINTGEATAADLEGLGEAVRADVRAKTGVDARLGDQAHRPAGMIGRGLALIAAAALGLALLGACQHQGHRPPCPPGALCLADGNGAEPTSLDPAHIDGVWESNIVSQMILGLTDIDADGKASPGSRNFVGDQRRRPHLDLPSAP